jgi:2-polyprenyl-3-methyl-5-hydroxy-6-metoxy-1,4-benzoquinol methylase
MSLYQRLLGHPFVYNHIRPFVVGGIDWSLLYRNLEAGPEDVILDVGCGTGIAHNYLRGFSAYHGYDTDPVAIKFAREKTGAANVNYECRLVSAADIASIRPTRVIVCGLLHHLSDDECLGLLRMCASAPSVKRVVTSDIVYLPGQTVSNLLAYFDRGKFVRRQEEYLELIRKAGLAIVRAEIVRSHPKTGKALYLMTTLARSGAF